MKTPIAFLALAALALGQNPAPVPGMTAKPEELAKIKEKTAQIDALLRGLKAKHADAALVTDVEAYANAGRLLVEIPDLFGSQAAIGHAYQVLDEGIERAHQLERNQPQWNQGNRQIH